MEEFAGERIIARIVNYIKGYQNQCLGAVPTSDSSSCIKLNLLFVKNEDVDLEAIDFFSQSLNKWKKMSENFLFLCRIKVLGQGREES